MTSLIPKLLLTATEAAAICGKSQRTWRTWDAAGKIPKPVRIGRTALWRRDELLAWIEAGCPNRNDWRNHPANRSHSA